MIGIGTNILLRLWLDDDPAQSKRIDALLAKHGGMPGSLLVTDVVLAEAVWTLKSAFDQDKPAQTLAVRSLLDETAFAFEDREVVAAALSLFESGSCGFADCLVVAKHARQGCDFTATLDRGMRKLPGVKVL
ncbi:MAG: type II toxin-antitoxin system VapC family toxin [Burkholderiaceae bacterium]|nr:type II toxin-antitoxin system VapC family toxin [Aquabacterium sp.]NUP85796.1 type II toxin-antitoxin system VapC family toxin [Burkholderiaceae bacterium]